MRIQKIELSWHTKQINFECIHEKKLYKLSCCNHCYELKNEAGEVIKSDKVRREFIDYCAHLSTQAIAKGLRH